MSGARHLLRAAAMWTAAVAAAAVALISRHRHAGLLPLRQEAWVRTSAAAGLERFARYLENHAAFDDYCRTSDVQREGAADGDTGDHVA